MSQNMIASDFAIEKNFQARFNVFVSPCQRNNSEVFTITTTYQNGRWWSRSLFGCTEELYSNGRQVIWSRISNDLNRFPLLKLTVETPVVSAHWASFYLPEKHVEEFQVVPDKSQNGGHLQLGVSVFESQRCTFVENTGASYVSRLPFRVKAAWPLKNGIILERHLLPSEKFNNTRQNPFCASVSYSQINSQLSSYEPVAGPPTLFTMFLMSHPLEEMTPVLLKRPGIPGTSPHMCFANDANQKIVSVIDSLGLIITINKNSNLHTIWHIEKAQLDDYAHLYLTDDDGRITVAPESLSVVEDQTTVPLNMLSTPIDPKVLSTPTNLCQTTPLQHRFQHLSIASSPFLSPFRASLQKLKCGITPSLNQDSFAVNESAYDDGSALTNVDSKSPSQSIDLHEHIRCLSAVSFLPQSRVSEEAHYPNSLMSVQNSTFALDAGQSFRKIRRNSKSCGFLTKPRSRHYSQSLGYSSIPGVFATASHPPPECHPHLGELGALQAGLDEPLLPKVCLKLLWTEKSNDLATLDRTVESTYLKTPRASTAVGDSPLRNPRVAALSGRPSYRPIISPNVQPTKKAPTIEKTPEPIELGPQRPRAFLAKDLVDRLYVCLLDGNQHLICLGVQSEALVVDSDEFDFSLDGHESYLTAVDAVYVPESRMTVCLEPNRSIMLYSGIIKVCMLGVIPALVSPISPSASSAGLNPVDLRPLTVRPPHSGVGMIAAEAKIAELLLSIRANNYIANFSPSQLRGNLRAVSSNLSAVSVSPAEKQLESTWRLCLPTGRHFTLAFLRTSSSNYQDPPVPLGNPPQVCEREFRIHLPCLASNTLVRHCLDAFRCGLPSEITLTLLIHWYRYRNPPTITGDTNELVSFARFLLQIFGLIPESGSPPPSPMETDSVVLKRHREKDDSPDVPFDAKRELLADLEAPGVSFMTDPKGRELPQWSIIRHLPEVLFCLHMVFENDKLDVLMSDQLKILAILNHVISRYSRLSSYVEYYSTSGFSSVSPTDLNAIPPMPSAISRFLIWPPHVRASLQTVPCLNRWCISTLSVKCNPIPYLYLVGANDTASALATFVLTTTQQSCRVEPGHDSFKHAVSLWTERIRVVGYNESRERGRAQFKEVPDTTPELVKEVARTPILLAFASAFVKSENNNDNHLSYQRAVLFLNELDVKLTDRFVQMPPAFASILRTSLVACMSSPPPNCPPKVYQLIGRLDLARQFEIMQFSGRSVADTMHKPPPACILGSFSTDPQQQGSHDADQVWSPAERWTTIVRPIRVPPNPITSAGTDGVGGSAAGVSNGERNNEAWVEDAQTLANRHFLLTTLENYPACQVSFKDLRLQEAYKLLQTSSHIWLPRICTNEATFGPQLFPQNNDGENASPNANVVNTAKARLDMHLAAACQRTSALPLGRGILGLSSLLTFPPPLLPVNPLCLRGRALVGSLSGIPVHQDLARGSLLETGRTTGEVVRAFSAPDNPANANALAIITAVVASGCAGSLKTACSLSRLLQPVDGSRGADGGGGGGSRSLAVTANNAALAATSALSSAILYTPPVRAARHWPEFHNGVALGLMVSPHASIDATWIVQNCKAIALGGAASAAVLNATAPSDCPYSPTQAGFLLGLGLNGHLNKLSAHYVREFTVQVHDLTNAAVMLGLCAGKRGSMDQAVLRLLAVHYRPLLLAEPVLIDMSVPSLCQAASAFGLGLLFQGSAHRHIASVLLAELGRPLGYTPENCGSGNPASSSERSPTGGTAAGTNNNDPSSSSALDNNNQSSMYKTASACGSGGLAGDSRELISLSAGFALGLVLLQRADSPCGLSDLAVANTLHAYMTGGRRDSTLFHLDACYDGPGQTVDAVCVNIPRPPSGYPLPQFLQPHLLSVPGCPRNAGKKFCFEDIVPQSVDDISAIPVEELADLGVPLGTAPPASTHTAHQTEMNRLLAAVDPLQSMLEENGGMSGLPDVGAVENPVPIPASVSRGSAGSYSAHTNLVGAKHQYTKNQQIRERSIYNCDVSAPGAIMALGFAYLDSCNTTISNWLKAPNTQRELESIRPDLLCLRVIAWGLVNYSKIDATFDWVKAQFPPCLVKALTPAHTKETEDPPAVLMSEDPASPLVMATATDVENRQPRGRTPSGTSCLGGRRRTRRQPLSPKLPAAHSTGAFALPGASMSTPVDYTTVSMSYLNILVGACFVIGLRYAGTSDATATELLHQITVSLLTGDWWPPNRLRRTEKRGPTKTCPSPSSSASQSSASSPIASDTPPKLTDLPPMEKPVHHAAATCLLALTMVVAGSGNLTVLRMVRKLRAIRFFGRNPKPSPSQASSSSSSSTCWPSAAETARLFQIASITAQTVPNIQGLPAGITANNQVSTASILGAVLAPEFGLQMVYGCVVGLLFLGGGRFTLSNTPEAAAFLTIAFFPRYPVYAGDNSYHLQCLRHLYVLAIKPRRLCGVNVLTNQVEPVTLRCWYKDKPGCSVSNQTAVFASDFWNHGSSIQLACGDVSTVFYHGTTEWKLLRKSLDDAGYFFVNKEPYPNPRSHFEKITELCLSNWTEPAFVWQLRVIATFLDAEVRNSENEKAEQGRYHLPLSQDCDVLGSSGVLTQSIATRVISQFDRFAADIRRGLHAYFFGSTHEKLSLPADVRAKTLAFRIWFGIGSHTKRLKPPLPPPAEDHPLSLSEFMMAAQPSEKSLDPQVSYWLHRFLYMKR